MITLNVAWVRQSHLPVAVPPGGQYGSSCNISIALIEGSKRAIAWFRQLAASALGKMSVASFFVSISRLQMLKPIAVIGSRVIVTLVAAVALLLAVEVAIAVVGGYSKLDIWHVMRASVISGVLIVMAIGMISYLIRKTQDARKTTRPER